MITSCPFGCSGSPPTWLTHERQGLGYIGPKCSLRNALHARIAKYNNFIIITKELVDGSRLISELFDSIYYPFVQNAWVNEPTKICLCVRKMLLPDYKCSLEGNDSFISSLQSAIEIRMLVSNDQLNLRFLHGKMRSKFIRRLYPLTEFVKFSWTDNWSWKMSQLVPIINTDTVIQLNQNCLCIVNSFFNLIVCLQRQWWQENLV